MHAKLYAVVDILRNDARGPRLIRGGRTIRHPLGVLFGSAEDLPIGPTHYTYHSWDDGKMWNIQVYLKALRRLVRGPRSYSNLLLRSTNSQSLRF
jgi:hypothetical protein